MNWEIPDHGCDIGIHFPPGRLPWPTGWEQQVDESCAHQWEVCTVHLGGGREIVVRCADCRVPRCGHFADRNPCMERRHHRDMHVYLDGSFEPVGGTPPPTIDGAPDA